MKRTLRAALQAFPLLMICLQSISCSPSNPHSAGPPDATQEAQPNSIQLAESWQTIDAGTFKLSVPRGWEFHTLQGIDSYVGEFVGDGVTLEFDFGQYSNPLAEPEDPKHTVLFEMISGRRAKIVVPRSPGHGTTGVYFGRLAGGSKLQVSGRDISPVHRDIVLKILRSIQVKDFKPIR
jgi:hypothetical protein